MESPAAKQLTFSVAQLVGQGSGRITVHSEAKPPKGQRIRLVWESKASGNAQLSHLAAERFSVCPLLRQNALQGLELIGDALAHLPVALADIPGLEVFELGALPALRVPGLLVMDMDSTAISIECIDQLAAMAGVGEAVSAVTERAMLGELDFEQSLRQRVARLAGADASIIDNLCARLPLTAGLTEAVAELKSYGWRLVLASGGFTPFVAYLQERLGLDRAFANELALRDGRIVGEVTGTVVDAAFKADVVSRMAAEFGIVAGQRLAIGDGANDVPMIRRADFGIAYHAKPALTAVADASIRHLDLRVLPFLLQA